MLFYRSPFFQYLAVAKERRKTLQYFYQLGLDMQSFCDKEGFGSPLFHAIANESLNIMSKLAWLKTVIRYHWCYDCVEKSQGG